MSIHRAKKKRCTLCRPAKKFATKTAVRQHGKIQHSVLGGRVIRGPVEDLGEKYR